MAEDYHWLSSDSSVTPESRILPLPGSLGDETSDNMEPHKQQQTNVEKERKFEKILSLYPFVIMHYAIKSV